MTSCLAKQASDVQKARFWSHDDKFTGFNVSWIEYVRNLEQEALNSMNNLREGTSPWKTMQRTAKYFGIIYTMDLNSSKQIEACTQMTNFLDGVEHNPLPSKQLSKTVKVKKMKKISIINEQGIDEECDVETEVEVTSDIDDIETGQNWIANHSLRELANQIEAILESSSSSSAYQTIIELGHPRDRNGFIVAKRLADVYGKRRVHNVMFPVFFQWGGNNSSLVQDWAVYKAMIDGGYMEQNKGHDELVIGCATEGFRRYHHHTRLLDHIRTSTPDMIDEGQDWPVFRNIVDKFFGDTHKQAYNAHVFSNSATQDTMTAAGIIENKNDSVNLVAQKNMFKSLNWTKKKYQNSPKEQESNDSSTQSNSQSPKKKKKDKKFVCSWCKGSHKTWNCQDQEAKKKWSKTACKNCKGVGHPADVCPNPKK